jgi:hypothetical protein
MYAPVATIRNIFRDEEGVLKIGKPGGRFKCGSGREERRCDSLAQDHILQKAFEALQLLESSAFSDGTDKAYLREYQMENWERIILG